jgi:cation diffusion facilitator CzcD-associated flavoprotein CzcO
MGQTSDIIESLSFDPVELRKKYLEERDKRLRSEGNAQYVDMTGKLEDLAHDPYAEPGVTRPPVVEDVDVAIFGGGFAGLLTAARLKQLGVKNLRIIEQAGDFGGTWYWNRYPGVRCDVESYIYMPLLEEVGTIPSEKYASGAEILAHWQRVGRHFGFYDTTLFQTGVTHVRWDTQSSRWIVRTNRGDEIRARFVVAANGSLHKPKLPGIPGLDRFKGKKFHTSRWDYAYTGGDTKGNLTGLRDKRVALIGSGATAIQIVPIVGEWAKHLYAFQRTPSAVDVRNNRPTDVAWFKSQSPGWQRRRMDNFLSVVLGVRDIQDMVSDRWTEIWSKLNGPPPVGANGRDMDPDTARQLLDYEVMEHIRARIDHIVKDPKTAESLKPWYNYFCKRPLYSDDYLQTFNRSNVTLVDTQGKGVERITESAIVHAGKTYEIDCLIFATGFRAGAYVFDGGGYEVVGKNGRTLREKWAKGVRSLHGIHMHGFPNFFIVGGYAQASAGVNYPNVAVPQAEYVAATIHRGMTRRAKVMEVSQAAEDRWLQAMLDKHVDRSKFESECTPGYYNNEGRSTDGPTLFSSLYGGGPIEYIALCEEWRTDGVGRDMDVTPE